VLPPVVGENERFYREMGMCVDQIVRVPYAVDNEAVRAERATRQAAYAKSITEGWERKRILVRQDVCSLASES